MPLPAREARRTAPRFLSLQFRRHRIEFVPDDIAEIAGVAGCRQNRGPRRA